jgi:hypothetical protein
VRFFVGDLPEVRETRRDDGSTWESLAMSGRWAVTGSNAGEEPTPTRLPATLNGQILPGEVDRFQFTARQGQEILAAAQARGLIPYLADAVPGWFQATLSLCDAQGNEVAYADDFRFQPDPVLHCVIPKDGTYTLAIQDAIYRGREDFVYRISVGELPYVSGIFPLGGALGEETDVELMGWHLPVRRTVVRGAPVAFGGVEICVTNKGHVSNRVPFVLSSQPELQEVEPNNQRTSPQPVALPAVVNGRIQEAGDEDVFRFEGRCGDCVVAEVVARRLGSPLDALLMLSDATGRELVSNDDHVDRGAGLITHHADSRIEFVLPHDGAYTLLVRDAQQRGGMEYTYRLRIAPPRPDYQMRVVPSSLAVRAGASVPMTVHVLRADGFTNDIRLMLVDAPEGITLGKTRLTASTNQFQIPLKVARSLGAGCYTLAIEGQSDSGQGMPLIHRAQPADDLMQAFIYHHLVPAEELRLAVIGRVPAPKANKKLADAPSSKPTRSVAGR